jgi:hypothetical protein|tara:strand:+ start:3174 stop:3497 length:324 start_codon:yes stop_codon:yes gene_type:complete
MATRLYEKESGSFETYFRNPITKEELRETFKAKPEALDAANKVDVEFYSANRLLLPNGITLDLSNKRFRFHVRLSNDKMKHIKSSKNLFEVIMVRKNLLKNLLGLIK